MKSETNSNDASSNVSKSWPKAGFEFEGLGFRACFGSLKDIDKTVAVLNDKIGSDPTRPPRIAAVGDTGYQFEMP